MLKTLMARKRQLSLVRYNGLAGANMSVERCRTALLDAGQT